MTELEQLSVDDVDAMNRALDSWQAAHERARKKRARK